MEICLKWVHMARYELILRLDGALWLRIISKPPLTEKMTHRNPKMTPKSQNWLGSHWNNSSLIRGLLICYCRVSQSNAQELSMFVLLICNIHVTATCLCLHYVKDAPGSFFSGHSRLDG